MLPNRFVSGQRWLSQTEPELGLGLVLKTETDRVTIVFPSTETTRVYTIEGPPLTRVKFSVGDLLKTQDGKNFTVEQVEEKEGTVIYFSKGKKIDESRLSDSLTFSKPYDRLLNAQVEEKQVYNLRHRALYRRFKTFRAPLRGLLNGRYTPRAHQLHAVVQATRFQHPRVLLADEPGMGKTVQAALILQRLRIFGNASRVLLLAPDHLMSRTETEFRRRFEFEFERLTEEDFTTKPAKKTVAKKAAKGAETTVFLSDLNEDGEALERWVSMSLEDFGGHRGKHAKEAAAAGWDVILVMGAEEVTWDEGGNAAWNALEIAAPATKSLILVSSLGPEHDAKSHFGRLHLLDPEAFSSPRKYSAHRKELEPLELAVTKLLTVTACDKEADSLLKPLGAADPKVKELHKSWKEGREETRDYLIDYLLDSHEAGRTVFRNTRSRVTGLPVRSVHFVKLEAKPEARDGLKEEFKHPVVVTEPVKGKPKAEPSAVDPAAVHWLAALVSPPPPSLIPPAPNEPPPPPAPPPPRALVITASRARAVAVEKALRSKVDGTTELVTDSPRADQGVAPAAVVVGAEDMIGRGFPGFDMVVLWDTPLTVEDARERLFSCENCFTGKLDIHIPVIEDTPQEMTARWLHDGLHAFQSATEGQVEAAAEFAKPVHDIAKRIGVKHNPKLDDELKALIKKTAAVHESAVKRLQKHADVFLETVSFRAPSADQALSRMTSSDDDDSLDIFMNRTLETLGILVETKGPRVIFVKPNPEMQFRFEDVPKEGLTFAYHRSVAATREDAIFLTWDHPLVSRAIEVLLATAIGNTAYVVWEDERAQIVLLEGIYLATPKYGPHPHLIARYMPATPVRVVLSHEFEDMSSEYTSEVVNKMVRNGRREWIRNNARPLHNIVPGMMRSLNQRAEIRMRELAAKAAFQMEAVLTSDIARLKRLPDTKVRRAEIKHIEEQIAETKPLFAEPILVSDQLRLIRRGPSGKGI
ncbi:MAG TPA: DEAD/DEAH box helicase family protein [Verrucomicrobiales bacterium]|nr:DEAD/DEAH box helicase family protein [Verrucomicrobiales bacterium]